MGNANSNYFDQNGVLLNKYGIGQKETLEMIEYNSTHLKIIELEGNPIKGNFDKEHLSKIHKHLFDNLYDWAGQSRDTVSRKWYIDEIGQRCRTTFCHPDEMDQVFSSVSKILTDTNNLKNIQSSEKLIEALVNIHQQLNHAHPFPEGNGRTLQVFMQQLAKEAGHNLDYTKVSKTDWNLASGKSAPNQFKYFGHEPIEKKPDVSDLTKVFKQILVEQKKEVSVDTVKKNVKAMLSAKYENESKKNKAVAQTPER